MSRDSFSRVTDNPFKRSSLVKEWAKELGFDLVGIAEALPAEQETLALFEWISKGFNASMGWMENNIGMMSDPDRVLRKCCSIIVVGVNYHRSQPDIEESLEKTEHYGKIAQFARGPDYHQALELPLQKLADRIRATSESPVNIKCFVDTGPVMEKAWASRAGLGFIGKNSLLINDSRGSWFVLGVILTTLDIKPDKPVTVNGCGTCNACVDACPTNALDTPWMVDANKCISYLTIEHRGEVDKNLAGRFNDWLFGCDICQEVCPYNVNLQEAIDEGSILGETLLPPKVKLSEILGMDDDSDLLEKFGQQSALRRRKLEGLKKTARALSGSHSS